MMAETDAISSASSSALDRVDDNPESKLLDTQTEGDVQGFINRYFLPEIARKFKRREIQNYKLDVFPPMQRHALQKYIICFWAFGL